MKVSIVSPIYLAEKIIPELVRKIEESVSQLTNNYEIILIDDRGPDNSWEKIEEQCQLNNKVIGLKLSRNFGQHNAIKAGIENATGDVCIVMDCDLQDDPKYISDLIDSWKEGNDIVYTVKKKRKHSMFKNITAYFFNKIFNYLTENQSSSKSRGDIGSYSLISRKVMDAFVVYNDYQFHYLMVLRWLGFSQGFVEIEHAERFEGKSSYNFKRLFNHAMVAIIYQSDKLLKMSIYFGFLVSFISLIAIVVVIVKYLTSGFQSGWASLVVSITFFSGVILIAIGILGLYIGKMFQQVKGRPQYIVDSKRN